MNPCGLSENQTVVLWGLHGCTENMPFITKLYNWCIIISGLNLIFKQTDSRAALVYPTVGVRRFLLRLE